MLSKAEMISSFTPGTELFYYVDLLESCYLYHSTDMSSYTEQLLARRCVNGLGVQGIVCCLTVGRRLLIVNICRSIINWCCVGSCFIAGVAQSSATDRSADSRVALGTGDA